MVPLVTIGPLQLLLKPVSSVIISEVSEEKLVFALFGLEKVTFPGPLALLFFDL
ncbi:MAG: hypothetical protein HY810_04885 [Candidatus Omnitrophica bacterium]|nr:hypothetical protein [Candidatus Omnitrophota bacterium]